MVTTSVPRQWTYNAFVSFRGEDIRKSFIDHLFKDFRQKGIHAFRDDNQLPRGEEISSQLYKAIEESRFLIVIFSKNYASSSWCLRELVKIIECKQMGERKHEVRIIFYDVKPNVVRKQTGSYAEAFAKHEFLNKTEVAKWKEALYVATNLSGWDLQDMANGYESKLIDSISKEILEMLCDGPLHVGEKLVGVDARVNKMNLLRFVGSSKVHMIGICGVGGIGKTTLAKAIYNLIHVHFEECSFLDDVQGATKRHGLLHVVVQLINDIMKTTDVKISNIGQGLMLMKQRMASRSILLVIDGIDHHEQLEALAGSCNWFFPGSLIIFTSKDKRLLAHKVDEIYDMEFLDDDEALELFSLYAFRQKHPTEDFKELTCQVVKYVQGHPLALKVLACFLYGQAVHVWTSELDKLQTYPNADIQQVIRLSFDGLDSIQQRVFLDIASYLVGEMKDFAVSVLDSCNFFADTNIGVLVDRSLVTISRDNALQMHNLIQGMAREIVREESKWIGHRSRLWIQSEVFDVLSRNKVTETVEVLVLLLKKSSQNVHMDSKAFACMSNLRILQIAYLESDYFEHTSELNLPKESKVKVSGSLEFLSDELRLLYWHGCPFKCLPSMFYPENVVAIDLSYSHIKNLWTTPKCFKKLKMMKLKHCHHLTNTPDFTEITNLEKLILEGCVNLVEVHPSIGMLKRLVILNMRNCHSLRRFPCKVEMDSLEVLIISGCSAVDEWPTVLGTMKTLTELHVDLTTRNKIPSFLSSLSNLQKLSICRRGGMQSRWWTSIFQPRHPQSFMLPSFASLRCLTILKAINCNISEVSPGTFEGLPCLTDLFLGQNNFTSLPTSLCQLSQLRYLSLSKCEKLEVLPELPPSLNCLYASDCTSLHELPKQPIKLPSHFRIFLVDCHKLCCLHAPKVLPKQPIKHRWHSLEIFLVCCHKLVEKNTIESLVSMFLPQGLNDLCEDFDMFFPGNRVPRWCTHQSMGSNVMVELPPGWCYNKFKGYEACVVFTLKKSYITEDEFELDTPRCFVHNFDGGLLQWKQCCMISYRFAVASTRTVGSDLIWFLISKRNPYWMKACNFITFSFTSVFLEVKQCGVRLICDEDIEEEMGLSRTQDLLAPTQDGGVFYGTHEWVLPTIEENPPNLGIL